MLKLNCHRGDIRGGTWLVGGTGAIVKVQSSSCSVLPLRLFAAGYFYPEGSARCHSLDLGLPSSKNSVFSNFLLILSYPIHRLCCSNSKQSKPGH